jgi:hypothetical protein
MCLVYIKKLTNFTDLSNQGIMSNTNKLLQYLPSRPSYHPYMFGLNQQADAQLSAQEASLQRKRRLTSQ